MLPIIVRELKLHAPFTFFGSLTGILLVILMSFIEIPADIFATIFWVMHPAHVVLSALVTASVYRLHGNKSFLRLLVIGYFGSVGIATLSDCIIPYIGEILLDLPNRQLHLGVIEKWWLINPLALAGTLWAYFRPKTRLPHAGHVLLSTWASLFHIAMAMGVSVNLVTSVVIGVFLFLAVWVPCCTSDIVFPLLFSNKNELSE